MKNKIFKIVFIIVLSIILTYFVGIKKSYCATTIASWYSGYNPFEFSSEIEEDWLEADILPKLQENFDYEENKVTEQIKVKTQAVVVDKKSHSVGLYAKWDTYSIRIRRTRYKNNKWHS